MHAADEAAAVGAHDGRNAKCCSPRNSTMRHPTELPVHALAERSKQAVQVTAILVARAVAPEIAEEEHELTVQPTNASTEGLPGVAELVATTMPREATVHCAIGADGEVAAKMGRNKGEAEPRRRPL